MIEKGKRKYKCFICNKNRDFKYRYKIHQGRIVCLSCALKRVLGRFNYWDKELKEFKKMKYKKQMILEELC